MSAALVWPLAVGWAADTSRRELSATLIWVTNEHVYVVPDGAERIAPGDVLEFFYRKKPLAMARVTSRDEALVVATVTSGSFERAKKKLSKVRVFALPIPARAGPAVLRIGIPSPLRTSLIFACTAPAIPQVRPPSLFHIEAPSSDGYRMVHLGARGSFPWPDTLMVRWFDEVADQEIALERGELDAALFWPGEPTERLRARERWGFALGTRAQGVIVAMWPAARGADADTTARRTPPSSSGPGAQHLAAELGMASAARLADLNEQLFRGDLAPAFAAGEVDVADRGGRPVRFTVDASFPGWRAIERFLNRGAPSDAPVVRIAYRDVPAHAADRGEAGMHIEPLFTVRYPFVWAPELTDVVEALGVSVWIEHLACSPAGEQP